MIPRRYTIPRKLGRKIWNNRAKVDEARKSGARAIRCMMFCKYCGGVFKLSIYAHHIGKCK
ncbi:MAG: hypothetical protein ACREHG_01895, partial [Candidatus Saccharimonadales bacterium]